MRCQSHVPWKTCIQHLWMLWGGLADESAKPERHKKVTEQIPRLMPRVTTTCKEHKAFVALECFTGAEISGFFFASGFPLSLLKSPTGSGSHQTPQRPGRAAQSPSAAPGAARQLSLPGWEPAGFPGSRCVLQGSGSCIFPKRSRLGVCTHIMSTCRQTSVGTPSVFPLLSRKGWF